MFFISKMGDTYVSSDIILKWMNKLSSQNQSTCTVRIPPASLSVYIKFSLHCSHKISCFVMIIHISIYLYELISYTFIHNNLPKETIKTV